VPFQKLGTGLTTRIVRKPSLLERLYGEVVVPRNVLGELAKVSGNAEILRDADWLSVK